MAGIKIDPEMLDIYMELLNKLMAGSETDGGNARLEVSGAGKTEDGLVRYNEEVNKLGDDLRELYGNVGEILGRIRDGTLFKNADKVSVAAGSTDGAGVLAKHTDETGAWLHGGKVFKYSDETAEAVTSGEKLLKESGTIYESFADMMSPEDAKRYLDFLENGSREGLASAELAGVEKADALLVSRKVEYEDVWDLRNAGDVLESGSKGGLDTIIKNGKVSIDDIKTNPSTFSGKSAEEIADVLRNSGYDVTIKNSTRSRSGAQIIQINNSGGGKNISQVQVSPGGGRHGSNPYVKISTTDQGIIKIVDGIEGTYKTDGKETATIIFSGGN